MIGHGKHIENMEDSLVIAMQEILKHSRYITHFEFICWLTSAFPIFVVWTIQLQSSMVEAHEMIKSIKDICQKEQDMEGGQWELPIRVETNPSMLHIAKQQQPAL